MLNPFLNPFEKQTEQTSSLHLGVVSSADVLAVIGELMTQENVEMSARAEVQGGSVKAEMAVQKEFTA